MAVAKRISYTNMNPVQKKKAEEWAAHWGVPVEVCPMSLSGEIRTNMKQMLEYMSRLDYNIISKDKVDRADITDEMREAYIESLKAVPSKGTMNHVKATFSAK